MKKLILFLCFFSESLFSLSYQSQKIKEKNLSWVQREKQIIKKFIDENSGLIACFSMFTFFYGATILRRKFYKYLFDYFYEKSEIFKELIDNREALAQKKLDISNLNDEIKSKELDPEIAYYYKRTFEVLEKNYNNANFKLEYTQEFTDCYSRIGLDINALNKTKNDTLEYVSFFKQEFDRLTKPVNMLVNQRNNLVEEFERLNQLVASSERAERAYFNFCTSYTQGAPIYTTIHYMELLFLSVLVIKYLVFRFLQCEEIDEESEFENLAHNERFKQFERSRKQQRKIHCG